MASVSTFAEIYDAGRAEVQTRNPALTDWTAGSFLDAIIGGGAVLSEEVGRVQVQKFGALFFDTAFGDELDTLAWDRLRLQRLPATPSVGSVDWTRDAAGAYSVPSGTTVRATIDAVPFSFTTTTTVVMGAADTTISIPLSATVAGRSHNLESGTVTEVVDVVGLDPSATITNPQVMAGGSEVETDSEFKARIRLVYDSFQRGTVGAIETGPISVPGVRFATVAEDFVLGNIFVYIGDPDAQGNDILVGLVSTKLELWRPAGNPVTVLASAREVIPVSIDLVVIAGSDQSTIRANAQLAIVAYGDTLGPGDLAYASQIECAALDSSDLVLAADLPAVGVSISPAAVQNALRFEVVSIIVSITEA